MKRALVIATVIAALAAAPAEAASPTLIQFNTLKRQVNALKTRVGTLERALTSAVSCLETIPISRYGIDGGTEGYMYQLAPNQVVITGALDLSPATGTLGEDYALMITVTDTACASVFEAAFPRTGLGVPDDPRSYWELGGS